MNSVIAAVKANLHIMKANQLIEKDGTYYNNIDLKDLKTQYCKQTDKARELATQLLDNKVAFV